MMDEEEFFNMCMAENAEQIQTINGVERQLDDDERATVCRAWAKAQIENAKTEAEIAAAIEAKKQPFRRLGLTDDEIDVVLGLV